MGDPQAFLALMERADQLGFGSIWLNELHFGRDDLPYPSPLLLGRRSSRVRSGCGWARRCSCCHCTIPLLLAEQVAQLDLQSGGRIDVGLGRGTFAQEQYAGLGISLDKSRARFVEAYDLLIKAWTQPTVSAAGEFWSFADVAVGPPPVQRPHPPVYIAGYTRESIAFAVDQGAPLLLSLEPPEERQLVLYREVMAERGRPADGQGFSWTKHICIGRTAEEADAIVDDLLPRLHQRRLYFAAKRGQSPDEVPARPRAQFLREQAIAGDPQACFEQIATLARDGVEPPAAGVQRRRRARRPDGAGPHGAVCPGGVACLPGALSRGAGHTTVVQLRADAAGYLRYTAFAGWPCAGDTSGAYVN